MTKTRVPWCDCRPSSGYSNARYRETGDTRDQWLCGDCWRPARMIFHDTDRWVDARVEWYGGTHGETEQATDSGDERDTPRGHRRTDPERVQRGMERVEALAEPQRAAGTGCDLGPAGRGPDSGVVHVTASHPPEMVTVWGNDGIMLTATETLVTTFPNPITGERADLLPVDEVAEVIYEGNEHRSWGDCLRLARALTDVSWAWIQEDPR